ncbi:uncharacterized protein FIBRA_06261 [Fibroporia radiculosa]|uniref:HTH La-type RNA-binding domain-containing protein n=1 Tax=Fibroporia radiculosa TaxID=599839 RepID=J4IB61_9APHY|nr:uncharacterized protein FIBRA_06261 [Fibroporia radiculosa]CCM04101.1 predicted protein [Fibroporia radiculosa]
MAAVEDVKIEAEVLTSALESSIKGDGIAKPRAESNLDSEEKFEIKSEDSVTSDNDKEKMLAGMRQFEFYFADSNLPFMWTLHTANPEHWVPIATVSSFKRMREYQSLGPEWITNALRMSEDLEINAEGTHVRRRTEVKEPKGQFERSIYAKGFGDEVDGLQKELEVFFGNYGKTNAVRMRRIDGTKEFKGSVFVEFADYKSVEAFLSADPKPSWKGEELLVMTKYVSPLPHAHSPYTSCREAYCDMKIKEKGLTGRAAVIRKQTLSGPGRKGFNAFREMDKSGNRGKDKTKGKEGADKGKPDVFIEFMGSKVRVHEDEDGGSVKEEDVPTVRGATLRFEGSCEDVSFDEIKGTLKERFARVPYVKYTRGEPSGLLGFDKTLAEDEIAYVKEHLKTLSGKEVAWSVPDGKHAAR